MDISQAASITIGSTVYIRSYEKTLVEKVTVDSFDKKNKQFLVSSKSSTSPFRVCLGEVWETEKESLVGLSSGFADDVVVLEKEIVCLTEQIKKLKAMDSALKRRLKTIDALESIRK